MAKQASLTLNEIRNRALAFVKEWRGEKREAAEKQSFWNEFFEVFGIHRRRYASYEVPVELRDGSKGNIDLFWPGLVLVEHKSAGKDLTAAFKQGINYFDGIDDKDLPKYVIVSDFERFRIYATEGGEPIEFSLEKLPYNIGSFRFLTGHVQRIYSTSPEVNAKAAVQMANLHEALHKNGYSGHPLAVLLVRLMFCFFADKTGILQTNLFRDIIERKTREDGKDVGPLLMSVFAVLDTPKAERQKNLDPDLAELEYVNGHLFQERFDAPAFDKNGRELLLKCLAFDWSAVSPAIFGAMFQGVMDEEKGKRRQIGAHYTSEKNILKVIQPSLIDPLRGKLESATSDRSLQELLKEIGDTKVLDPACGCGNFLLIAYRELRRLEIEAYLKLKKLRGHAGERLLGAAFAQRLDVDSMYGIEVEDFPCRIAETALYIMDHMMNNLAEEQIGPNFRRLPLKKTPHITRANALQLDWTSVVKPDRLTCIVGNPPFVGKKARSQDQIKDMNTVFEGWDNYGELDYVSAWYVKAAKYIQGTSIKVAFVSTSSLTHGEQVSVFWPRMLNAGMKTHFAHRPFRWDNDASGEAHVYCVIIGWGLVEPTKRFLFDYETPDSEPMVQTVDRINPYLLDFDNVFISARRTPVCDGAPKIVFGSMANHAKPKRSDLQGKMSEEEIESRLADQLLLTDSEKKDLLKKEPGAFKWIRKFIGTDEFLYNLNRWCLWMEGITPAELRAMPHVMKRIQIVKANREASPRPTTKVLAATPWLFGEIRQPNSPYIAVPRHSSENRQFIPMGFCDPSVIAGDALAFIPSEDLYVLGVLQSTMHMAWVRHVCGRLEGRYRYSNEIVYNNFPWPENVKDKQKDAVRNAANALLNIRAGFTGQSLADLYDTDVMPPTLIEAHGELDKAVDRCYRSTPFANELARIKYLFEQYSHLASAGQMNLPASKPRSSKRNPK